MVYRMTIGLVVFAYEQTSDPTLLRIIWRQFLWMMDGGGPKGYEVKDVLWALPTFKANGLLERWGENIDDWQQRIRRSLVCIPIEQRQLLHESCLR